MDDFYDTEGGLDNFEYPYARSNQTPKSMNLNDLLAYERMKQIEMQAILFHHPKSYIFEAQPPDPNKKSYDDPYFRAFMRHKYELEKEQEEALKKKQEEAKPKPSPKPKPVKKDDDDERPIKPMKGNFFDIIDSLSPTDLDDKPRKSNLSKRVTIQDPKEKNDGETNKPKKSSLKKQKPNTLSSPDENGEYIYVNSDGEEVILEPLDSTSPYYYMPTTNTPFIQNPIQQPIMPFYQLAQPFIAAPHMPVNIQQPMQFQQTPPVIPMGQQVQYTNALPQQNVVYYTLPR